jgi:1-acyl-sn-glycerol-3-phosphate acyltransferase
MANDRFTSPLFVGMRFVAQRLMLKPLVWSLVRVKVSGKARLRGLGDSFIVVANHSSHLDAPLIIGGLPYRNARYLAAGAAADYFFDVKWRKWLTALFFNAFPVDRGTKRSRGGLSKGLLERGIPLMIFPEGGRSQHGELGRFKPGAAALAISCDVPVVPIALVGANVAMPRGQSWPSPGRLRVAIVFGAPMRHHSGETPEDFSYRLAVEVARLHSTVTIDGVPAIEAKEKE